MVRLLALFTLFLLPINADAFSTGTANTSWTGERFKNECVDNQNSYCEDIFAATVEAIRHVDQNAALYLIMQHQKLKHVLRKNKADDSVKKDVTKYSDPKYRQTISKCFPKDKNLYDTLVSYMKKTESLEKRSLSEIIHMAAFEHWICKRGK